MVGVVSGARSDYGFYRPILREIERSRRLALRLYVTGMHLSAQFGRTISDIEEDGVPIHEVVEMLVDSDTPGGMARSIGLGTIGFAQVFSRGLPDLLLVLGDRFEMLAAVTAALPFPLPVAHLHGGEVTEGAVDDSIRHAITKMSHLHFVATEEYRQRVIQMGEEPWRVVVTGAPTLDNLRGFQPLSREELVDRGLGAAREPFLLVCYHPVTRGGQDPEGELEELLAALSSDGRNLIFTAPNADTGGRLLLRRLEAFTRGHPGAQLAIHVGTEVYFSLMAHALAMVGNSSSGLIEAPSFRLPVVNVGPRQAGRTRGRNVIDVECQREEIRAGIARACSGEFRAGLQHLVNPYGDGTAAERIVAWLEKAPAAEVLLRKRFYEGKER